MGPLAACVYGAHKALPIHDTYIRNNMLDGNYYQQINRDFKMCQLIHKYDSAVRYKFHSAQ